MKLNFTMKSYAAAIVFLSLGAYGQTTPAKKFGRQVEFSSCGTSQYEAMLQKKNPARADKAKFERWLAPKIEAERNKQLLKSGQNTNVVVTIPVVIHVIHNGDAVGTNENIAHGQIMSQLTVLNQDFRKMLGTNGYNTNPVGADVEIEFCLAQRDEAGVSRGGIIRYNLGSDETWEMEDVEVLKTQTQWDPTKYLNIWIVNAMSIGGFLELAGYAQFPTDSGLDGLDEPGIITTAGTDGVVIAASCFGSEEIYPDGNYMFGKNLGRTATHEIGHFFGLRHIWGDESGCNGNDYCNDTPVHAEPNQGCPEPGYDSCPANPGTDMYQNYMDYSDDTCMNIFTAGQKDRMLAVLANSPRRASLITSDACIPGIVFNNDGTLNIQGLNTNTGCETSFNPQVVLTNTGSNIITTATISYALDDAPANTFDWTGSLPNSEQVTIDLPVLNAGFGSHTFAVHITSINGEADEAPLNDTKSQSFDVVTAYDTQQVIITIQTDDFGEETLWALVDSNENPIATNINFDNIMDSDWLESNQLYTFTVDVVNNECYAFGIIDALADGICCENGDGFYTVKTTDGTTIAEGGEFTQQELSYFRIDTSLSTENNNQLYDGIVLYPNPATSSITLSIPHATSIPDGYVIYNSLGQVMATGNIKSHTSVIDVNQLSTGVYFVKVSSDAQSKTLQFIKN